MRCLVVGALVFLLAEIANAQSVFPPLTELETQLERSPEMDASKLEVERLRRERAWLNWITIHGNYSQHFSSVVPFVISESGVSGGTSVGISASLKLAKLFGKRDPGRVEMELKRLEVNRLYLRRLAELRILYRRRLKLIARLGALRAEGTVVALELERVRAGLRLAEEFDGGRPEQIGGSEMPILFDPIDLATATARVVDLSTRWDQAHLDIANLETQMLELVGLIH